MLGLRTSRQTSMGSKCHPGTASETTWELYAEDIMGSVLAIWLQHIGPDVQLVNAVSLECILRKPALLSLWIWTLTFHIRTIRTARDNLTSSSTTTTTTHFLRSFVTDGVLWPNKYLWLRTSWHMASASHREALSDSFFRLQEFFLSFLPNGSCHQKEKQRKEEQTGRIHL